MLRVLNFLITATDIDVNVTETIHGYSALIAAAGADQDGAVKLLLRHPEIDINTRSGASKMTALDIAVSRGRESIVRLILDHPDLGLRKDLPHFQQLLRYASLTNELTENIIWLLHKAVEPRPEDLVYALAAGNDGLNLLH